MRPGAPAGPQTTTTRPDPAGTGAGSSIRASAGVTGSSSDSRRSSTRGRSSLVGQAVDTDPRGPCPGRVRAPATGDGDDAHLVAMEEVDGGLVEPRGVEGDQCGVRLAGAADGEQVVDVDAPLEHHQPGTPGDQLQHR